MTKPSVDQKAVLREQLRKMDPEQWLAMVRWFAFKLVEDPELTVMVITDEAERRRQRYADNHVGSELLMHSALMSVLKDLSLYIGQQRQ
jgi:hypothetical protein